MARLFGGVGGTSGYDAANAVFNEVASNDWTIYDYGTAAGFENRVDVSVAGVIMDCGECHVGGGGMEYIPFSDLNARTPLREITTTSANGTQVPITEDMYTAFNYFIDTYDVDEDGDEGELQYMDYANTGVMEMDCLLCHMPGYDYAKRNELLRDGKIDATRPVPAGFAVENTVTWASGGTNSETIGTAPAGYGTLVNYDESQFDTSGGTYTLSASWFHNNISAKPDSVNCAYCHMNKPGVDWKKRGDNWAPIDANGNPAIDGTYEVHYNIGCMGCHERKPTAAQPDSVNWRTEYLTQGAGMLGHDPAKGTAPFSSLYNTNDDAAFKSCDDCHLASVEAVALQDTNGDLTVNHLDAPVKEGEAYGAPNPNTAHAAYGLTAKIVQDAGMSGARISHIDLMTCSACHSRKVDSYDWNGMGTGNNGNPMVDATGNDHEGRLTDHENDYIIKTDMTDRSALGWYKGKLMRVSYLNTLFWRDKNDFPSGALNGVDANEDGKPNGMDALLMTQVNAVNEAQGWISMTEDVAHDGSFTDTDGDGIPNIVVTNADIDARVTALTSAISTWTGDTGTPAIKLSMMHVAFKDQHGVSPASMAWGSGAGNDPQDPSDDNANPCLDCHSAAGNFYNGAIDTVGDNTTLYWDNDVVPFTKVNGFTQATDMHPNVKDRFATRSLASRVTTGTYNDGTTDYISHTDLGRATTMYESTFMGKAPFAASFTSSAAISFTGFEKGWLLRVQVEDQNDGSTVERTRMVNTNVTDLAGLIANLDGSGTGAPGADFTSAFEFDITDNLSGGLTFTAKTGYLIRLTGSGSAGAFNLAGGAWVNTPWTGVDGSTNLGRADWVAYLNDLDGTGLALVPGNFGIGVDPVAAIDNINGGVAVETGVAVNLVADTSSNTQGQFTYEWIVNDVEGALAGTTASKTFDRPGTWTVTLKVYDEEGKVDMAQATVVVSVPDAGTTVTRNTVLPTTSLTQAIDVAAFPAETDRLRIFWGDGQSEYVVGPTDPDSVSHVFSAAGTYSITVYAQDVVAGLDPFGQPTGNDIVTVLESQTFDLTID